MRTARYEWAVLVLFLVRGDSASARQNEACRPDPTSSSDSGTQRCGCALIAFTGVLLRSCLEGEPRGLRVSGGVGGNRNCWNAKLARLASFVVIAVVDRIALITQAKSSPGGG